MAAIHQNKNFLPFVLFLLSLPPPLCASLPLLLSVNTTLQLLTLNSGGDKDQAWPSHLQCHSLERKTHNGTHTHIQMPGCPPTTKHRQTNNSRACMHNILPRIPRTRWAVWLCWCETRMEGSYSGAKKRAKPSHLQWMFTQASTNIALSFLW